MWQGHRTVVVDLGHTEEYNAAMPKPLDISPAEEARHGAR